MHDRLYYGCNDMLMKDVLLQVRMTERDRDLLKSAAKQAGMSMSEWVRQVSLQAARSLNLHPDSVSIEIKMSPGGQVDRIEST